MRRTSLTQAQATQLAAILRTRRNELMLSTRQVSAKSGLHLATISGLESGDILAPQPDTLMALALALGLSVSDLYAAAEWLPADELPNLKPYMRAKYRDLPDEALGELDAYVASLATKYGLKGPIDGEDER